MTPLDEPAAFFNHRRLLFLLPAPTARAFLRRPHRLPLLTPRPAARFPPPHNPKPNIARAPANSTRLYAQRYAVEEVRAMAEPVLRVVRMHEDAALPVRASSGAAGYDLSAAVDTVVPAAGKAMVSTGLKVAIPEGCYARIAPRSSLAAKKAIDVGAGVVDYDYRGEVKVILFNFSTHDFAIAKGDRIAQLILERILTPEVVEVQDLDSTDRGEGGFGSTGERKLA